MQSTRRTRPAAPLLAFAPDPPAPTLPKRDEERPQSTLFKIIAFLPLVFIFGLLAFAAYAFLYSLCIDYLLVRRNRPFKAVVYASVFLWLFLGCGGSVWMAYWRGGGVVPGAGEWKRQDDEARLEQPEGVKNEVGRFVLGAEDEDEEEEVAREAEQGDREDQALLEGDVGRGNGEWGPAAGGAGQGMAQGGRLRPRRALQVKSDGGARFCRKCNVYKPDRAHHCSSCRRCILKMDHHCPWLGGGCVGWANYKFFLLFLLYTGALGAFIAGISFQELVNFVDDNDDGFDLAPVSWAIAALLGAIFGFAVGLFGLYHLYLAASNRTTIEAMEPPTSFTSTLPPSHLVPSSSSPASTSIRRLAAQLSPKQRHRLSRATRDLNVYDLGWKENLRLVFGGRERWWLWGVPWGWPPGDGQSFPISTTSLSKLEQVTREIYADPQGSGPGRTTATDTDADTDSEDEDGLPLRRA
ncbi:hypothetical protein JCM5296_000311 [Sporobolomyces johnsonii]